MTAPAPAYRPLHPAPVDQGDPFLVEAPPEAGAAHRFYAYTTGGEPDRDPGGAGRPGRAFPAYASDDLVAWRALGPSLAAGTEAAHWAPCVRFVPGLPRPWVMLYSRAVGRGPEAHVGHTLRRADADRPEGPFVDTGPLAMPGQVPDFAIDPDVYRHPATGRLTCAYAVDFVEDEPYGTGIVEAPIADDLAALTGPPRTLARPSAGWHLYEAARVMPWKTIPGVDWATDTVRWSTVEGPVGGLVSPDGRPAYLYSGGNFAALYAVGALVEEPDGTLVDLSPDPASAVVAPDAGAGPGGLLGPGHCSWLRLAAPVDPLGLAAGDELIMLHARFGSPAAPRQLTLARLTWHGDHPIASPVIP